MNNPFKKIHFLKSAQTIEQAPPDVGAEVAFAGRSNAGKSSAINTITEIKALARISKTPGRTQLINFFTLDEHQRLVDLPGYGFAKVPLEVRQKWQRHLERYLSMRESLRGLVLVMDIRHPLKEFDWQMLEWCHAVQLPVHILLTKADKLKRGAAMNTLQQVQRAVDERLGSASVQIFSALKRQGIEQAHATLLQWLNTTQGAESK